MVVRDELQLLKPLEPSLQRDSDAWPEFVLRQARVVSQKTGKLIGLLSAGPGHLVTVTGKLGKLDKDTAHLAKTKAINQSDTICIRDVGAYSFSQYEGSGGFGFWAAGKAGWYEFRTSADNYTPFYQSMEEAAEIFYYLADRYRDDARIRSSDQYIHSLASGYVKAEYSRRRDPEDAKEAFYEHRDFLLRSMLEGQEGLDWATSPILRHLRKQFPAEYQAAAKSVRASGKAAPEEPVDAMEVDEKPLKPKIGTRAERLANRNSRASGSMELDDEEQDTSAENPELVHALRGALRPRVAQSSKRYTGPDAPEQDVGHAEESAESESDSEESMAGSARNKTSILGEADADTDGDGPEAHLSRFLPQPSYYEPTGPGDTWTCSFDGCNEKVWDARKEKSRKVIEEHFSRKHAAEMHDLIVEESGSQASVRHLLNRVQNLRTLNAQAGQHLATTELPQRVVRRY